jgi:hypothetical protein
MMRSLPRSLWRFISEIPPKLDHDALVMGVGFDGIETTT